MFIEDTIFILGAGASFWCGYPLGDDLIGKIISDMNDEVYIPIPKEYYQRPEAYKNDNLLDWIDNDESFRKETELFLNKSDIYPNEGFINSGRNYVRAVQCVVALKNVV